MSMETEKELGKKNPGDSSKSQQAVNFPSKYKDMPFWIAKEMIGTRPIYADPEKEKRIKEKTEQQVKSLRAYAEAYENGKTKDTVARFQKLSPEANAEFTEAQKQAAELLEEIIKNGFDSYEGKIKGLDANEFFVLKELEFMHDRFIEEYPGQLFTPQFSDSLQKLVIDNLIQRLALAFSVAKDNKKKVAEKEHRLEELRKKLGAPESVKKPAEAIPIISAERHTDLDIKDIKSVEGFMRNNVLEDKDIYLNSIEKATNALENGPGIISIENEKVPTIIVSDIHARRDFLVNILNRKVGAKKETVKDLLEKGEINIVCVGDGMHSERSENWSSITASYKIDRYLAEVTNSALHEKLIEFRSMAEKMTGKNYSSLTVIEIKVFRTGPGKKLWEEIEKPLQKFIMEQEMVRSLGTMKMIMDLKAAYPKSFHYIRGNHDDMNEEISGFSKFANESADVKQWVTENYGHEFLSKYTEFERKLPVMVVGKDFVVSHTIPKEELTLEKLNGKSRDTLKSITWTDNTQGGSSENAVKRTLQNVGKGNASWFIGHRDVDNGLYRNQYSSVYQMNNKDREVVALVSPTEQFNPDTDIFDVSIN